MKRYKLGLAGLVIILVILAIPRVLLIPRLSHELEGQLAQSLNTNDVQVRIRAPFGWEVLFGRLPGLDLVAHDAVIDGLRISRVEIHGEHISFDPRSLWQEQEVVYTEASNLQGEIVVTEDALNELWWEEVDLDRFLTLQVSPQGIDLRGTMSFWNMEWTLAVRGDLEVHHGTALRYVLKNFEVQETRIPSILLEILSENYEFVIDFGVFPYPVEIKNVLPQEQQILVTFGGLS